MQTIENHKLLLSGIHYGCILQNVIFPVVHSKPTEDSTKFISSMKMSSATYESSDSEELSEESSKTTLPCSRRRDR